MAANWSKRERKLSVKATVKKMGRMFKQKETRDKTRGKQRKIYNRLRRLREDDENISDGLEDDNGG